MKWLENFLSRRLEVRYFGIAVVLIGLGAYLFGVLVHDGQNARNFGRAGIIAMKLAEIPAKAIDAFRQFRSGDMTGLATVHSHRFPGQSGWTFHDARIESGLDRYLLFSRYDGDAGHHVFELVDLKEGKVKTRTKIDADMIFEGFDKDLRFAARENWQTERFQGVHPIILDSGDIMAKGFRTPMFRITPCGSPVWVLDKYIFHHTIERDPDGNYWSPSFVEPGRIEGMNPWFQDTGLVKLNDDGEILHDRSLTKAMIDSGLEALVLAGPYDEDPTHLNDIQPVPGDGPYWKAGDVFLSLRHSSSIMLYRPETGKIVWWKQGPWSNQHDVDIINDTTIGIYDNNSIDYGEGFVVDGISEVLFYDFATDTVTSPFREQLERVEFRNDSAGLYRLMSDGHLYVDESESGRTLIFTPDGELAVEHVNRAENGLIYHLGWSRIVSRETGDKFLARATEEGCALPS